MCFPESKKSDSFKDKSDYRNRRMGEIQVKAPNYKNLHVRIVGLSGLIIRPYMVYEDDKDGCHFTYHPRQWPQVTNIKNIKGVKMPEYS